MTIIEFKVMLKKKKKFKIIIRSKNSLIIYHKFNGDI